MSVLFILNRNPYDGTDVIWNALRLVEQLLKSNVDVRMFLMNDSVDLARDMTKPPEGYFDLVAMLKELISKGVTVKVCATCEARCGIHKGKPFFRKDLVHGVKELAEWITNSDKIVTF